MLYYYGFCWGMLVKSSYTELLNSNIEPMTSVDVLEFLRQDGIPLEVGWQLLKEALCW